MVPHKSRRFRAILDLSFRLRLESDAVVPSVNEETKKTARRAAVIQIGHALARIVHTLVECAPVDTVFLAKWDVKDGFWREEGKEGEDWNCAYVLPQQEGAQPKLVVPSNLQMGWIESPPYFSEASETARDVAEWYSQTPVGSMPAHKFENHCETSSKFTELHASSNITRAWKFLMEVYVDNVVALVKARTKNELQHVARAIM